MESSRSKLERIWRQVMGEVIIRHWKDGDDEGIFALFDRTARWVSNEAYGSKFDDEGLAPEGIIVAEQDGLIIGHLMGTRTEIMCEGKPSLFGGIGQVMVDERYRGRGIGKAMLQRIIQYHEKGKCLGILLWTQDRLIPAYPMYKKLGFRVVASRVRYRFQPGETTSTLSIEPYTEAFAEQAEEIRQEWMRASFPVGVNNMKPTSGRWQVILKSRQAAGYVHIGDEKGIPLVTQAVAHLAEASEVCDALFAYLREAGYEEAIWQTCSGSIWEDELHKRGSRNGQLTADVRMCLSIGSPVDIHGQRPEFDGCSTW